MQSWGFQYCCSSGEGAAFWEDSFHKSPKKCSNSNPPFVGNNRDSPAFDLAQFSVGDVDLKGQAWHPHRDLQGSAQVLVREVHKSIHLAFHLLAVDKNVVTPVRNLRGARERGRRKGDRRDKTSSKCNPGGSTPKQTEKAPFSFCMLMMALYNGSS